MRSRPRTILTIGAIVATAGMAAAQGPVSPPYGPPETPAPTYGASSGNDAAGLLSVLSAARGGDGVRIREATVGLYDPLARKIALWALDDSAPASMTFAEADSARRQLDGWPHASHRQIAAELLLSQSGLPPASVIAWFGGADPLTGQGALALAIALRATGQVDAAAELIRRFWRSTVFDAPTQQAIMASFGVVLTQADHTAREDLLLYGSQGQAAQELLPYLPPDQQALAQARMAVRRGDPGALTLIGALPPSLQNAPGLVYERVISLRDQGEDVAARFLISRLPDELPPQAAERLWKHGTLVNDALKQGDVAGAYAAAAHCGLTAGQSAAEAEFEAGWLALTRLHNPRLADDHFARLQTVGQSPLTQSRAFYWRGRAAEAVGDPVAAQLFYGQAARYFTTFYGQLAAVRSGAPVLTLGRDPEITAADRASFQAREPVRAMRLLTEIGARDTLKVFAADLADTLPTGADEALLVDLVRGTGDQEASMRVVRNAAKRGFILPERGYPVVSAPRGLDAPDPAFVLGVVRQESSFDPMARSGPGARGMMQLMPGTAQVIARKLGVSYSTSSLDDPDYNMRLGSAYLSQLLDQFSGSYVMAAAAYNAGPGRPTQWTAMCGDPRSGDPLDFIECIPFSETLDYVIRVLEAAQVYRARLNGGSTRITLQDDLRRGAYSYHPQVSYPAAALPQTRPSPG